MGFVGVGTMGFHMASSLLRAGMRLVVCDTNNAAADRLSAMGAAVAPTPAQLAATPGTTCCQIMSGGPEFCYHIVSRQLAHCLKA